jgi:hypothetical protein
MIPSDITVSYMHFNIYLDDQTGQQLKALAERHGETRNALIRRALREWIDAHEKTPGWPREVMEFEGMPDMEPFENHRQALL